MAAGGWRLRLVAGRRLVAGGWWLVAFLDLLGASGLSLIFNNKRFIRLVTTREIWEAVSRTFYDGSDETRLFELNQKSFSTTQNGRSLPTYYNELVAIFQKIDHRSTPQAESFEGIVQLHAAMMRLQLIGYLEWWDFSKQPRKNITGKAAKATSVGAYYWKRASRKEEIKVKMMVADDGTLSKIVVQGDDQQVEQMRKELQFSEKGMVYVKGIFERWQKLN
ncbi:hypothetical protein NC651_004536 [Populus alba x Populus x berolinensis]|nr:hypothetical protein NC651_004536 [Populus alba x Populus x berolinensis]